MKCFIMMHSTMPHTEREDRKRKKHKTEKKEYHKSGCYYINLYMRHTRVDQNVLSLTIKRNDRTNFIFEYSHCEQPYTCYNIHKTFLCHYSLSSVAVLSSLSSSQHFLWRCPFQLGNRWKPHRARLWEQSGCGLGNRVGVV